MGGILQKRNDVLLLLKGLKDKGVVAKHGSMTGSPSYWDGRDGRAVCVRDRSGNPFWPPKKMAADSPTVLRRYAKK
ncbi:MAG TPA: hypothetical protein VEY10_17940 [Flavisolibacter sp.]|nr:hypothetical protein [Flavisolibacter sp.]